MAILFKLIHADGPHHTELEFRSLKELVEKAAEFGYKEGEEAAEGKAEGEEPKAE